MEDQRVPGVSKAFADKGPSCYDEGAHRAEDKCHLNDDRMLVAVPSNRTRNCFIYQGGEDGLTHSGDDNVEDDVPHDGVGESHLRHLRTLEVEEHKRQEVEQGASRPHVQWGGHSQCQTAEEKSRNQ